MLRLQYQHGAVPKTLQGEDDCDRIRWKTKQRRLLKSRETIQRDECLRGGMFRRLYVQRDAGGAGSGDRIKGVSLPSSHLSERDWSSGGNVQ